MKRLLDLQRINVWRLRHRYHSVLRSMGRAVTRFWLPAMVASTLLVLLVATGQASEQGPNTDLRALLHATTSTPNPNEVCNTAFETHFPYEDPQTVPEPGNPGLTFNVTIGGEDYTSAARGAEGVRLRDFRDALLPVQGDWPTGRPGGTNYADVWYRPSGAGNFSQWYDAEGVILGTPGGLLSTLDGWPQPWNPNAQTLGHSLPNGAGLTDIFEFAFEIRLDEISNNQAVPFNIGAGLGQVGGQAANGHQMWFGNGQNRDFTNPAGNDSDVSVAVVDHTAGQELWTHTLVSGAWPPGGFHEHRITNYNGHVQGWYRHSAGGWVISPGYDLTSAFTSISHINLAAQAWRPGMRVVIHFRNARLDWVTQGRVSSVLVPLPAGYTRYGTFRAATNSAGTVQYFLVDAAGTRPILPDTDLSTLNPPPSGAIRLQAVLERNGVTDPTPLLVSWSVDGCRPTTPTPTATTLSPGRPTPTPTNTPQPTRTPRPTSTPGGYFQIAPLKPAVHLKVDHVLGPPPYPNDQTDWRESDALYYPLQVYAGLVPFAFADPASPPQLCYWSKGGWVCVNGTIQLQSYTLRGIEMNGVNYLDLKVKVGYARPHFYQKWHLPEYRFSQDEYTYVNWLAPDGVLPACPSSYRCANLLDVSAGNYQIVYDVTGNIHWNAIPGVGGPYDYGFTNTYRVPIGIAMPRAEP